MAQFCTKCGTPIPEGMKFCTGCGATIGEPSAPAVQAPVVPSSVTPPAAPAPPAPSPVMAAPAPSSGSPVVKIILIVVAVFIFLSLLSAGACVYFVYRAKQRVSQFEKQVHATFPTSMGTREVHTQPAEPAGTPAQQSVPSIDPATLVYPGATAKEGAAMMAGALQMQEYLTDDPVDKVLSFYKEKLGPKALVQETNGQALVQLAGPNGLFSITIAHDEASGKTKFSITRIGK